MKKALVSVAVLVLTLTLPLSALAADKPQPPTPSALHSYVSDYQSTNSDVAAWIEVPGTGINLPLPQAADNTKYLRQDLSGETSQVGTPFLDFRCRLGADRTRNISVYGQNTPPAPDGTAFSQLTQFRDPEFAAQNRYICFATDQATEVYEIFSVAVLHIEVPYAVPNLADEQFELLLKQVRQSSLHTYTDVEAGLSDQFLTLVTPDFSIDSGYPNDYRLVIMAKRI